MNHNTMSNDAEYTARCLKHYPKRQIEAMLETEDAVKKELGEADQVFCMATSCRIGIRYLVYFRRGHSLTFSKPRRLIEVDK